MKKIENIKFEEYRNWQDSDFTINAAYIRLDDFGIEIKAKNNFDAEKEIASITGLNVIEAYQDGLEWVAIVSNTENRTLKELESAKADFIKSSLESAKADFKDIQDSYFEEMKNAKHTKKEISFSYFDLFMWVKYPKDIYEEDIVGKNFSYPSGLLDVYVIFKENVYSSEMPDMWNTRDGSVTWERTTFYKCPESGLIFKKHEFGK